MVLDTCARCDEDKYEEFLNEVTEQVQVCNFWMEQGTILRQCDEIAFRCGMSEIEELEDLCPTCKEEFD